MTRLELPDGNWAQLCSPKKVQERKRRRYINAMADVAASLGCLPRDPQHPDEPDKTAIGATQLELVDIAGDLLILCLVKEWSFGDVTLDVLQDLDADRFDPILKACRDRSSDLLPDYSPDIDPKAPTGGSTPPPPESSTEAPTYATLSSDGTS